MRSRMDGWMFRDPNSCRSTNARRTTRCWLLAYPRRIRRGSRWAGTDLVFVSLLSDSGVSLEDIADLCGHSGTTVTEKVYRHQLRPVLLGGAAAMDQIFRREP